MDFNNETIASKYIEKYGSDRIIVKRRVSTDTADKSNIHRNFLYGERCENHRPYRRCAIFNNCGKGVFKLHGKVMYYHNAACKSVCILLGKEHLFKQHFSELFNDQTSLQQLNDEICPYCVEARPIPVFVRQDPHMSDLFKDGMERYKSIVQQEIDG